MKKYNMTYLNVFSTSVNTRKPRRKLIVSSLFLAIMTVFIGCEAKEDFSNEQIVLPPVDPQEIVQVASDDGFSRVNSLSNAIMANGDGIYELERGGVYYLEGKTVISNNVVIRAAYGTGSLPIIQPISDAQGAINADMLRLESNVTFENVYFDGRDAASAKNVMQRLFRIDVANVRLKFEGCIVEYCRNFCIRTDNVNSKIYINNSIFRNFALTSDPANGRLFDSRGNAQDTLSITNSTLYNMTGHIARFDGAIMNCFEFKKNTVYNVGFHMRVDYAMTSIIEDNIFADVGWKASYDASLASAFWDIKKFSSSTGYNWSDVKITIRNNNVYFSPQIKALYAKYPGNIERIPLSSTAQTMISEGQMIYQNNISEELTFDRPSPLPMEYIDKFFEVLNTGMSPWADLPFFVEEPSDKGNRFNFNYSASSMSATASTSGGALGAPMWKQ